MPRIDPERLLKCLQPLLDPFSGAIKSSDEVDKIFGLMSKFSKKLVSKCIYINILRSSNTNVVDLFMQRGGWGLVFGWTNEAITSKNYPLLKEILNLLLQTPTTIARLKENKFPVIIKSLSKDCEDLDTKNIAKQVVSKWISVARGEEVNQQQHLKAVEYQHQPQISSVPLSMPLEQQQDAISIPQDMGSLNNMATDSLLNIDPSQFPDVGAENLGLMDDFSQADLSTIDFNIDILSSVVDATPQTEVPMQEIIPTTIGTSSAIIPQIPQSQNVVFCNNVSVPNSFSVVPSTTTTAQLQPQSQPQQQINNKAVPEVVEMIQVQSAPKIYIKTIAGQRTVVQGLDVGSNEQYCLVFKDGKNLLVKMHGQEPASTPGAQPALGVVTKEGEPSKIKTSEDNVDSSGGEKLRKETKHKKPKDSKNSSSQPVAFIKKSPGGSGVKTYGKPPLTGKDSSVTSTKKGVDQNVKPEKSEKDKKSSKEKSTSNSSDQSLKKSKSSSSRSKTEAAAAAAKLQEDEDKLKEEIRKQKQLMKKRAKEAKEIKEKQKQQEKDQETLKKLNLAPISSSSTSSGLKIPKIPKKSTSFIDAIGIPGADGVSSVDKIKKVASDIPGNKAVEDNSSKSPTKKSGDKKENEIETKAENDPSDKPKERRHKAKVFVSSKSRSDDLLKEMTESAKPKSKEKEKEKQNESSTTKLNVGNSLTGVPPKVSKRLSTESIDKPGDHKKAKLDPKEKDKSKEKEDKEASSPKEREKEKKKPSIQLKESSLFMDMLNASSETTKSSKRKRRPSTSTDKEKPEAISPVEKSPKLHSQNSNANVGDNSDVHTNQSDEVTVINSTPDEPIRKPVFNFYRDTLNDSPEEDDGDKDDKVKGDQKAGAELSTVSSENVEAMDQDGTGGESSSSFTPQETDGHLKSALVLHRARNRPRKSVRWKEEEELKEFHYFEMDETERVNVTKQKDFTQMSQFEKAEEREYLRKKQEEEELDKNRWRMVRIEFINKTINPVINSQEKLIQEERESTVLGLFLPPGAILPETAVEPDPASPADRIEPKFIPVEDVNSITKVCDYRQHSWPAPKTQTYVEPGADGNALLGFNAGPMHHQNFNNIQNTSSGLNAFPPQTEYNNPWSATLGFSVPPPVQVPTMPDLSSFQNFAAPGFGFVPGPNQAAPVIPFPTPNPFAFPPPVVNQSNGPALDGFGSNNNTNNNRDGRLGNRGRSNDSDTRRNYHGSRDNAGGRDRGGGNRDYNRDDKNGRDRDFRRRDNRDNRDRDYRHYDRDNRNNRDHRSGGRNSRKDIPCKFFMNGHCNNGSRCQFLHDASSSSNQDSRSERRTSSPDSRRDKDVDQRAIPVVDMEEDWDSVDTPSQSHDISSAFADTPSSPPAEPEVSTFATSNPESAKVIPV